jgi:hypothetical protein
VYEGERAFMDEDGIEVVPVEDFLEILANGLK